MAVDPSLNLSLGKKIAFSLVPLVLLLGFGELGAWGREKLREARRLPFYAKRDDAYRNLVLEPHSRKERAGGVAEINAWGMRAPEISETPAPHITRVIAIGGSTTYGLFTSRNDLTWPARTQARLHAAGRPDVEVLNAGVPAWDLRTSQTNLELRLYALEPDVVIAYHAYNDLVANLDPRYVRDSRAESLWQLWRPLRVSALYRFLRRQLLDPGDELRNKASQLSDEGSEAFERNLRRFVRRTREEGARPVLCTYPTALRDTLEESERAGVPALDYWVHRLSPFDYPTLVEGLRRYNDVISRVAEEESVPVVELARLMPKRVELYESTVHHSDEGEDEVARIVAEALLESGVLVPGAAARSAPPE